MLKKEEPFYLRLKRLRTLTGKSVRQIASEIGVPSSTYREWEYGRAIKGEPYVQLAHSLGVGVTELLTGETSTPHELVKKTHDLVRLSEEIKFLVLSFK